MKTLNEFFSKIYCINLDKRVDRYEESLIEFKKLNIDVERVSAIDGKSIFKPGLNWSAGAYGLLLTHIKLMESVISNKYDNVLILEDDVMFNNNFNEIFNERISALPNDWDFLYLGGNNLFHRGRFTLVNKDKNFIINSSNYYTLNYELCKTTWTQCAHAVAINSKIYNLLMQEISRNLTQPIDVTFCGLQNSGCNAYTFLPSLARQRASFSDIENKSVDYNSYTF